MKEVRIKNQKNDIIAHVFLFFDYERRKYKGKQDFVDTLIKDISKIPSIGYAGFKSKKELGEHLLEAIFGAEKFKWSLKNNFYESEIEKISTDTFKKCHAKLKSKITYLFIFPNFNKFKKEKLSGVGGFSGCKNTILIDVNPVKGWRDALKSVLAHEYNHSVVALSKNSQSWTLLDSLVYEGMADVFSEEVTGKTSIWLRNQSEKKNQEIFQDIKKYFSRKDDEIYQQIFLGKNKKYPLWVGYSVGYWIVKEYLKSHQKFDWKKIIATKSDKIFKKSSFFSLHD